ncbi:MAG: nuclear transport factor 2 family protein [Solirubrobacterales bacterium]
MSAAPAEVVRAIYAAWNSHDIEQVVAQIDESFEADMSERVFNPEVYRGQDGVRRFFADTAEIWKDVRVEITDLYENGDFVLATFRAIGKGIGSGLEVAMEIYQLWTVRDGRAVRFKGFQDRARAFEEAGLADPALG